MARQLNPSLIQLISLGVESDSDHYLQEGIHLRWFPNQLLGFPRSGFNLYRRAAPGWSWLKRRDYREAKMSQAVGTGGRYQNGPLFIEGGDLDAAAALHVDGAVRFSFLGAQSAAYVAIEFEGDDDALVQGVSISRMGDVKDDTVIGKAGGRLGDLRRIQRRGSEARPALFLSGGVIDEFRLATSKDVHVSAVLWLDANATLEIDWKLLETFLLPISGDGRTYPTQPNPKRLVEERLSRGLLKAQAPYAEVSWPPPQNRSAVEQEVRRRYLETLESVQVHLEDLLRRELSTRTPQGRLLVGGLGSREPRVGGADEAQFAAPALGLLLSNALEPGFAHMLGLATRDTRPPVAPNVEAFDYMLEATYPNVWLVHLFSEEASQVESFNEDQWREVLLPPLREEPESGFVKVCTLATNVARGRPAAVPTPAEMSVTLRPAPGRSPLPVVVDVRWERARPARPNITEPHSHNGATRRLKGESLSSSPRRGYRVATAYGPRIRR